MMHKPMRMNRKVMIKMNGKKRLFGLTWKTGRGLVVGHYKKLRCVCLPIA